MRRRLLIAVVLGTLLLAGSASEARSGPWTWSVAQAEATLKRQGIGWERWGRHVVTSARCRGVGSAVRRSGMRRFRQFACYVTTKETCPYHVDVHVLGRRGFRVEFVRGEAPPPVPEPIGPLSNDEAFADTVGDAHGGPDISTVSLESYSGGLLRVRVSLANRSALAADESIQILLNPNERRSTAGGGFVLAAFRARSELARWNGSTFAFACGLRGNVASSTLTLEIPLEQLERPDGFNFLVRSYSDNGKNVADKAPDSTFWNYQTDRVPLRSATFSDPLEDSGAGPDLARVDVSSYRGGLLLFRISVPNRVVLTGGESVQLFVDSDRNRETGSSGGSEYVLAASATRSVLGRWTGSAWNFTRSLADSSHAGGVTRLKINVAEVDVGTAFNFTVQTFIDSRGFDRAPDRGSWMFDTAPP